MDNRKIKLIRMKADCVSVSDKKKVKTIFAEKGEILKVNAKRDNVLIIKGKKEVFPVNISDVDIVEYE